MRTSDLRNNSPDWARAIYYIPPDDDPEVLYVAESRAARPGKVERWTGAAILRRANGEYEVRSEEWWRESGGSWTNAGGSTSVFRRLAKAIRWMRRHERWIPRWNRPTVRRMCGTTED